MVVPVYNSEGSLEPLCERVSAVFGAAHAITRMYALLCFLMGLYLGGVWMIDSPRNLSIPIVVHGLYDFVALIYLVRLRGSRS